MRLPVAQAVELIESKGLLKRERQDQSGKVIAHVAEVLGRDLPTDLIDFSRERIARIGDFTSIVPDWNEYVGWRMPDSWIRRLLHLDAVPIFDDGCGNIFGLDLRPDVDVPAVYFFDHERDFEAPEWAAGSSIGTFLLILAESDRAVDEGWPDGWELEIDPDIERCPRAPAIWNAG